MTNLIQKLRAKLETQKRKVDEVRIFITFYAIQWALAGVMMALNKLEEESLISTATWDRWFFITDQFYLQGTPAFRGRPGGRPTWANYMEPAGWRNWRVAIFAVFGLFIFCLGHHIYEAIKYGLGGTRLEK